ncbi:MAG: ATP-binding protein [Candidatus Tectomicrobia bacterium]|nr:ATP-binding protein [Candidatus Tectomicrobia bacterium]
MKRYGLFPEMRAQGDWCLCGSESGEPKEWLFLGRLSEYGRRYNVKFDVTKEKVIAIVGKRGQGKSYTLGSLIEGLCTSDPQSAIGVTTKQRGVLLFDTLNIFQWMNVPVFSAEHQSAEMTSQAAVLRSWGLSSVPLDVDVWIPAGYRYRLSSAAYRDLHLNVPDFSLDDWSSLLDLDLVRDIKGQYFSEVFQKVVDLGWTNTEGSHHRPSKNYTIGNLTECIQNDEDNQLSIYRAETRRAVLQQLRAYERHPIFSGSGTPLRQLVTPGRASVVLLNGLPEDLRGVLVSVMIRRLLQERSEASEAVKDLLINPNLDEDQRRQKSDLVASSVPKCWVVIDEAQNVIPAGKRTSATASLVKFVKEGRNFGLSFVVTTQQPRALDPNVLSQVETFIVHKLVSQSDIDYILDNLKSALPSEIKDNNVNILIRELIRDIVVGQALVSDTNSPRCFVMEVRPRVSAHGGFEA